MAGKQATTEAGKASTEIAPVRFRAWTQLLREQFDLSADGARSVAAAAAQWSPRISTQAAARIAKGGLEKYLGALQQFSPASAREMDRVEFEITDVMAMLDQVAKHNGSLWELGPDQRGAATRFLLERKSGLSDDAILFVLVLHIVRRERSPDRKSPIFEAATKMLRKLGHGKEKDLGSATAQESRYRRLLDEAWISNRTYEVLNISADDRSPRARGARVGQMLDRMTAAYEKRGRELEKGNAAVRLRPPR